MKRQKERLPYDKRGYCDYPRMNERTDGRMVVGIGPYEIRCESPHPGTNEICVKSSPDGTPCEDYHWCLRSDDRGRIYGHHWNECGYWDWSNQQGTIRTVKYHKFQDCEKCMSRMEKLLGHTESWKKSYGTRNKRVD